ncbi:MAG: efflux RND transporter periplasmic adaptor subunit [Deltaproteobacteria bacterium]|nr:efflux RND transporter periplasmic adaptor subunit [Deltaproteobacteria bacterium]MDH3383097.1 efflux RND transporter periplasmic adaptor subunit [Deltaproteobacteria bacterium]
MQFDIRCERRKLKRAFIVLASGLLLGGCQNTHGRTSAPPPIPDVAIVTVGTQPVVLTTDLPGRTSAYRVAEIRPQVNGLIQRRLFSEGAIVKAGQALYQIDPASFQAALGNAKAALGRAEANLPAVRSKAERYGEALADNAVSRQDYDDAAAALKQAEADVDYWKATVEAARINLGYTRITAPISGRIGRSNVTEGALVTAHQPMALATIQQMDPVYVDVPQATSELLGLKRRLEDRRLKRDGTKQNKVRIILEDGTPYPSEGTLQFQDVSVDPTTGSVTLRVIVPNPDGVLLPGMYVRAILTEGVNAEAILVPQQGVAHDPKGNPLALVVDGAGKVEQRMLHLDRAIDDKWLVASGLSPGDRLIVEGLQNVRPGDSVNVVPMSSGGEKGAVSGEAAKPAAGSSGGR